MTPDELYAAFSADERAAIESARQGDDNQQIVALVMAAAARLGVTSDKVYGLLLARLRTKKTVAHLSREALVRELPYPLGWKLGVLLRDARRTDDGESAPQLPFHLFALVSALLRMTSVVLVQSYVARGGADAEINRTLVETLAQSLVDEKWLGLARFMSDRLGKRADVTDLDAALSAALKGKPVADSHRAPNVGNKSLPDVEYLIALRNKVAHGECVDEEYVRRAVDVAVVVLTRFEVLATYRLVVRSASGGYALEGEIPRPIDGLDPALPVDEPCLVPREGGGPPLSLSPLLRFRPAIGDVAIDELFFLNAGVLDRLSYVGFRLPDALDGRSLGSYEAFRELMKKIPSPELPDNPRLDFTALARESTRFFVGRQDVLAAIEAAVRTRPRPYAVVRALPGMGKTSILARLHQSHPPVPAGAAAGASGDRWCFHFCGSEDGRNSPIVMMRSLMTQAADAVGLPEKERASYIKSTDLKELRDQMFPALIALVAKKLGDGERLVLAIDALDEGFGGEDPIASVLPRVLPANAIAIVSWRVDPSDNNARVENAFRHVAEEARQAIEGAAPLRGLTRQNVADFVAQVRHALSLGKAPAATYEEAEDLASAPLSARPTTANEPVNVPVNEAYAPAPPVLDAVWSASQTTGGADPFYLRFLAQGAERGTIDLDRAESMPRSLDDAFEDQWLALPADRDFALHRLLLYLGILREPGTDALLAELLTRERPNEKLTPDDVASLRIAAGKLLVYDGDRYKLFHDRFRRFLVGEQIDPVEAAIGAAAE